MDDHNAQVLLNTIVYQVGYFFALSSGNEHRCLRYSPTQIQLYEPRAYLINLSWGCFKNQPGRSYKQKEKAKGSVSIH